MNLSVHEANQQIREAYRQGCDLLKQLGDRVEYGTMAAVAREQGISAERIRKLRQIAQAYTLEQLKELLAMCKKHKRAIGVSYLFKLVSVPTANCQRDNLQVEMLQEGWSRGELDQQILARFGRRGAAGKRKTIPPNLLGLVSQVEHECSCWLRWQEDVQARAEELDDESLAKVVNLMKKATSAVRKLQTVSAELLETLREEP